MVQRKWLGANKSATKIRSSSHKTRFFFPPFLSHAFGTQERFSSPPFFFTASIAVLESKVIRLLLVLVGETRFSARATKYAHIVSITPEYELKGLFLVLFPRARLVLDADSPVLARSPSTAALGSRTRGTSCSCRGSGWRRCSWSCPSQSERKDKSEQNTDSKSKNRQKKTVYRREISPQSWN